MAGMQETDHITLKNGITYLLQDAKARAKLADLLVEVMEKYGADNPPPYPVTSVNGHTGDVDIPTVDLPVSVQDGGTDATTAAQAAENLSVLPLGEVTTKIPSGADFNDYDSPGVYAIGSNSTAATIANMPSQSAGTLRVFASTGAAITASSTWKYLIQEYITFTGARYQRYGGSGSGTAIAWDAWETIYADVTDLNITATAGSGITIRSINFSQMVRIVFGYIYFDVTSALSDGSLIATLNSSVPNPRYAYTTAAVRSGSGSSGMVYIPRGVNNQIKAWGKLPVGTQYFAQFMYVLA